MPASKYFTVEEANALLPQIEPLVGELMEWHRSLMALASELEPAMKKASGNGGHPLIHDYLTKQQVFHQLILRIHAFGCQIKDVGIGLIDFPGLREGREICLCWRLGEDEIHFWHETDAGFAGRQPL